MVTETNQVYFILSSLLTKKHFLFWELVSKGEEVP